MLEDAHNEGRIDLDRVCDGHYVKDQNGVLVARLSNCPIQYLRVGMRDIMQRAEPFYLGESNSWSTSGSIWPSIVKLE